LAYFSNEESAAQRQSLSNDSFRHDLCLGLVAVWNEYTGKKPHLKIDSEAFIPDDFFDFFEKYFHHNGMNDSAMDIQTRLRRVLVETHAFS
jgi:hypothetical protein